MGLLIFKPATLKPMLEWGRENWHRGTNPVYGQEEPAPKGFYLVGDQGVYLMPNCKWSPDTTSVVAYAEGMDPHTDDDWWEAKCDTFGGDDGADFIELESLMPAIDLGNEIHIKLSPEDMVIYSRVSKCKS